MRQITLPMIIGLVVGTCVVVFGYVSLKDGVAELTVTVDKLATSVAAVNTTVQTISNEQERGKERADDRQKQITETLAAGRIAREALEARVRSVEQMNASLLTEVTNQTRTMVEMRGDIRGYIERFFETREDKK